LTDAVASTDLTRNELLKIAGFGVLTGILTPLLPVMVDKIIGLPGNFQTMLVAIPFAVLVFILVRRRNANSWWAAPVAALVTLIAFTCAVNAAIWVDGQAAGVPNLFQNILAGMAGGFTGAAVMALGIGLLPSGPRTIAAWLPMLATGTLAGVLLAFDSTLDLDVHLTSVLYPVWQAGVAVTLAMALRR
jgi:hypothetical protein